MRWTIPCPYHERCFLSWILNKIKCWQNKLIWRVAHDISKRARIGGICTFRWSTHLGVVICNVVSRVQMQVSHMPKLSCGWLAGSDESALLEWNQQWAGFTSLHGDGLVEFASRVPISPGWTFSPHSWVAACPHAICLVNTRRLLILHSKGSFANHIGKEALIPKLCLACVLCSFSWRLWACSSL